MHTRVSLAILVRLERRFGEGCPLAELPLWARLVAIAALAIAWPRTALRYALRRLGA